MSEKGKAWNAGNLGLTRRLIRHHPSEVMLRALFSKRYCSLAPDIGASTRVLDIGTMYLNNLVPFLDRGCASYGVEVNEEMLAVSQQAARDQDLEVTLSVGTNRDLPFPDGMFDIILALNVIHYEDDAEGLTAALKEYKRALTPGGRAFIVTAGPEHHLRASATRLGPNRYQIEAADDFRKGQTMAYFEDEADLKALTEPLFRDVATGRMIETHDQAKVDFLYAVCRR
jgi:SAM-dependent methyltransferase